MRARLTEEQQQGMDAAWAEKQVLQKNKRARTEEEKRELECKSKRDVRIAAYKYALGEAQDKVLDSYEKKLYDKYEAGQHFSA